jgi:TRAP-type C4-dicarboxylate transport system permease small subunit
LTFWQTLALYAVIFAAMYLLKMAFPEQVQAIADAVALPALALVFVILLVGGYRRWQEYAAQPPRRP